MGGAVSAGEDNDDLIDNLVEAEYIKTPLVESAFRAIDRADYYIDDYKETAYKDLAWKQGNLHMSAPCIYSEVMESLNLQPGLSFLNLGSGTGYLSTMVGLVLGLFGVNHGVELHGDVVDYANRKLDEFLHKSQAIDEYEFCKPKFVVGNCLQFGSGTRLYDRVYCGAGCPSDQENYMKNLIKVGGILVMPLNDQLLQITRTAETKWEVKSILPVSFASLVLPNGKNGLGTVRLPECHPLPLQEVCREAIRRLLRRNIGLEYPHLKRGARPRRPRKRRQKKRRIRKIVIPIFEENDETMQVAGGSGSDEERHRDEDATPAATAEADLTPDGRSDPSTPSSSSASSEAHRQATAQLSDMIGEVLRRHRRVARTQPTDDPMDSETSPSDGDADRPAERRERHPRNGRPEPPGVRPKPSAAQCPATIIWRRITFDELESDSEREESSSGTTSAGSGPAPDRADSEDESEPKDTCGSLMRAKILQLPLPPSLRAFVNYYRDF